MTLAGDPPVVSINVNPSSINESASAIFNWSSTKSTSCSSDDISGVSGISGGVGYTAPSVMSSNQNKVVTITCTGPGGSASATANLPIYWINDAPNLSIVSSFNAVEDATFYIPFSLSDEETPNGSLSWSVSSSDQSKIANGNIVVELANNRLRVTPQPNANGPATINMRVTDAHGAFIDRSVNITVAAVNDPPTMSTPATLTIEEGNTSVRSVSVNVFDVDGTSPTLTASVSSYYAGLISAVSVTGSGSTRTVNVTPTGLVGSATINLTLSDGAATVNGNFSVVIPNLDPVLLVENNNGAGQYTLRWRYGSDYVYLDEQRNQESWTTVPDVNNPNGTKAFTKTRDGTYTYRLYDCTYSDTDSGTADDCQLKQTQQVTVNLPAPSVPTLSLSSSTSVIGNYTVSWSGVSGVNSYELLENNVAVNNGGNALFTSKNYSTKTTGVYRYKVRACNSSGCSAYSPEQIVKVANPLNVTSVIASMNGITGVASLLITIPVNASYYEVQTSVNGGTWSESQAFNTTNINLPPVTTTGSFTYQVRACDRVTDTAGEFTHCSAWRSSNTVIMPVPSVPTLSLSTTNATGNYSISWNSAANTNRYVLNENGSDLPAIFTTSHNVTKANGSYVYKVKACNAVTCGVYSTSATIDVAKVGVMGEVTATLDQSTAIPTVSWSPVSDSTYYELQPFRNGEALSVPFNVYATSFTFDPMTLPGDYHATLKACAQVGAATSCSAAKVSNTVSPIVPATAPRLTAPLNSSTGQFTLKWSAVNLADKYELYENNIKIATVSGLTFNFLSAKPNGNFSYKVKACKALCGKESNIAKVSVSISNSVSSSSLSQSSVGQTGNINQLNQPITTCPENYTLDSSIRLCVSNSNPAVKISPDFSCAHSAHAYNGSSGYCEESLLVVPPSTAYTSTYSSDAQTTGEVVGTLPGDVMVTPGGAAAYSIPLSVPKGVGNFTPTISLDYSSGGDNEIMGVGWSLSAGVASVTRCAQTLRLDGQVKGINYSESDRFCVNGARLLLVSGTYGHAGSEYALENDDFSRYKAVGGYAGHPDYFEVIGKNGSKTTFGDAANSRQYNKDGTHALSWSVSKREDRSGNLMTYHYTKENTEFYISELKYAYALGVPLSSVKMNYTSRQDPQMRMIAGQRFEAKKRLSSIDILNSGSVVKTYHINYADVTNKFNINSRVESIQECAGSLCLPKTTFEWSGTEPGFGAKAFEVPIALKYSDRAGHRNNPGLERWKLLDTDRDGVDELYYDDSMQQYRRTWQGNGFGAPELYDWQSFGFVDFVDYTDLNGDGQFDMHYSLLSMPKPEAEYQAELAGAEHGVFVYRNTFVSRSYTSYLENGQWRYKREDGLLPIEALTDNRRVPYSKIEDLPQFGNTRRDDINGDGIPDLVINGPLGLNVNGEEITGSNLIQELPRTNLTAADLGLEGSVDGAGHPAPFPDSSSPPIHTRKWVYTSSVKVRLGQISSNGLLTFADPYDVQLNGKFAPMPSISGDFDGDGSSEIMMSVYDIHAHYERDVYFHLPSAAGTVHEVPLPITSYTQNSPQGSYFVSGVATIDANNDGVVEIIEKHHSGDSGLEASINFFDPISSLPEDTYWDGAYGGDGRDVSILDLDNDGIVEFWNAGFTNSLQFTGSKSYRYEAENLANFSLLVRAKVISARTARLGEGKRYLVRHIEKNDGLEALEFYPALENDPALKLEAVVNGLGARTEIDYEEISYSKHYKTVGSPTDRATPVKDILCLPSFAGGCSSIYNGAVTTQEEVIAKLNQQLTVPPGAQTLPMQYQAKDVASGANIVTKVRQYKHVATTEGVSTLQPIEKQFFYARARSQLQRGWLGFESMTTRDVASGLETQVVFRQDFPFTGTPYITEVRETSSGKVLNTRFDDLAFSEQGGRYNVYSKKTTQVSSDESDSSVLKTQVTDNTVDAWGNVETLTLTTTGLDGEVKIAASTNSFANDDDRRFGLIGSTEITTSVEDDDFTDSFTKKMAFTYTADGLLKTSVTEPDKALYTSTVTKTYDTQGNLVKEELSAPGLVTRTSYTDYDSNKRFVTKTRDGKEQIVSQVLQRNALGQVTQLQNANGLISTTDYNKLGQEVGSYTNTGAWTKTKTESCNLANTLCIAGAAFELTNTNADGSWSVAHVDAFGRTLRTETLGFDGTLILQDTHYTAQSQVAYKSDPYYAHQTPVWTHFSYNDVLSRLTKTESPGTVLNQTNVSTLSYSGFTTTQTNALNQTRTETKNAFGQVIAIEDYLGGRRTHQYDAEDRLRFSYGLGSTSDPHSLTTELRYDALGRKVYFSDPDKGITTYDYNAFGELIKQTDAEGNTQTFYYDLLGRLEKRTDKNASNAVLNHSRWYFDGAAPNGSSIANAIGQISGVVNSKSANDETCGAATTEVCEIPLYDTYGRAVKNVQFLGIKATDGIYATGMKYDDLDRVVEQYDALNQRLGASGTRLLYNEQGFNYAIQDLRTGIMLYQISEMSARGQVVKADLGNGITQSYAYNSNTGRIEQQTASDALNNSVQSIAYEWDDLGNLNYRHNTSGVNDSARGLTKNNLAETFCYDGLNRLTKVKAGDVTCTDVSAANADQRYNSLGSIVYKNGVGTYTYANSGNSHAVTSTSDGNSFTYDAKGNLLQDNNRQLQYTVFDVPSQITRGSTQTQFNYDADRSRWKKVDTINGVKTTTLYLGSIERIQTQGSNTVEWRRYASMNTVDIITTNKTFVFQHQRTQYVLKDEQGSPDVITDEIGAVTESMSFDAWGKRRVAFNGSALSMSSLLSFNSPTTTRGYTNHEMLDSTGYIHMNGRVYDPMLARFVSADIMVPDPMDVQSYNRYSYVRNRPLSVTDPSGFSDNPVEEVLVIGHRTNYNTADFSWASFNSFIASLSIPNFVGNQQGSQGVSQFGIQSSQAAATSGAENLDKTISETKKLVTEAEEFLRDPTGAALNDRDDSGGITFGANAQKGIEKARALGIKRIDKLRGVVAKAIDGKKGALRQITKYFGADAASNLSALDSNLASISAELSTATITAGDPAYIAKRLAEGDTVGAWVSQAAHPDTIFYNPSLTSNRTYFSALLVHEAAHLAGFGHEYFQGAIAYGGAGARGLAGSSGWSVTSNNASSYACAAYTRATDC